MFNRLFGNGYSEQLNFLQVRCIVTIIAFIAFIVSALLELDAFILVALFPLVLLFVWGWPVVKNLFGITTIGAIFSDNPVIAAVLFFLYLFLSIFAGVIFAFLGLGRWIYLKVKLTNQANE